MDYILVMTQTEYLKLYKHIVHIFVINISGNQIPTAILIDTNCKT